LILEKHEDFQELDVVSVGTNQCKNILYLSLFCSFREKAPFLFKYILKRKRNIFSC